MAETSQLPDPREHYARTDPLRTRMSVWGPTDDGRTPMQVVAQQILAARPSSFLDIGTGLGALPAMIMAELPQCRVAAVDQSAAMVAAARTEGVAAEVADIATLPFGDAEFEAVAATWMLYHVPDLDAALREVTRVLHPEGLFVAATNGAGHLAELFDMADLLPPPLSFSRENGAGILRRYFGSVSQIDLTTHATFADSAAAETYLRTIIPEATIPPRDAPLRFAGKPTVFVARDPQG